MSTIHRDQRSSSATLATAALLALVVTGVACVAQAATVDLLVSSEFTNSVKRYDGVTGVYLGEFVSAGVDGPVEPLGGLTFGPDGNLYVGGGHANAYVKRFDGITGAFIDTVTSAYPPSQFGFAFGPDGYLYGSVFVDDYVFVVDPTTGAELSTIGAGSPLDGPTWVTFGADGDLYVSSWFNGVVLRFDGETGDFIDTFATLPPSGRPSGTRFGPDGDLYVLVWYCGPGGGCPSGDIWRFDGTTGASKGSFLQPGDPHPVEPFVPVFGPDGTLLVTSHGTDEVLRYDATGHFIDSFVTGGGLDGPTGLVFMSAACADGIDNDGDGVTDFGADLGCASEEDTDERGAAAGSWALVCDNGVDDDGDGLADYPDDPGCFSAAGYTESPRCNDGADNDGDGAIDHPADPECTRAWDTSERAPGAQCGIGFELAFVLPPLLWLYRRRPVALHCVPR